MLRKTMMALMTAAAVGMAPGVAMARGGGGAEAAATAVEASVAAVVFRAGLRRRWFPRRWFGRRRFRTGGFGGGAFHGGGFASNGFHGGGFHGGGFRGDGFHHAFRGRGSRLLWARRLRRLLLSVLHLDDSYYDDGSCYVVQRRVHTRYGWRYHPVQVCG